MKISYLLTVRLPFGNLYRSFGEVGKACALRDAAKAMGFPADIKVVSPFAEPVKAASKKKKA